MDEHTPITLGFEPIVTLPPTAASGAMARIQQVVPVPGLERTLAALDTRGVIWLVEDGAVRDAPLLDLRGALGFVEPGPEAGLRSLAFHPEFATPAAPGFGKLYVAFSAAPASPRDGAPLFEAPGRSAEFHDVVAELTIAEPSAPMADLGAVREVLRVAQPFGNHNFGQLLFEPATGHLLLSLGDGGSTNDPLNAAEDLGLIYGKILRIDPLGGPPYAVPEDNPFVGTPGARPEIYAFGLRNPQQMSLDQGRLITGEIGQDFFEEINIVLSGANYGWDDREGLRSNTDGEIGPLPADDAALGLQYPITGYAHREITTGSAAVAGGVTVREAGIPDLDGAYIFANFPTGELFALPLAGIDAALADGRIGPDDFVEPTPIALVTEDGDPTSFAEVSGSASGRVDLRLSTTADGAVLAFSKQSGTVFQLTADPRGLGEGLSEEDARTVALLYEAGLDRNGHIDLPGLNFWIDRREEGLEERDLAAAFLASPEFAERFGDPETLSDAAYVDTLYQNVLERAGDPEGQSFWTGVLALGFGRDTLLLTFATSAENISRSPVVEDLREIAPGEWDLVA